MSANPITNAVTQSYSNYACSTQTAVSSRTEKTMETQKKNDSVYGNDNTVTSLQTSNNETTFPISSVIQRLAEYTKVINEHYAKVNEENKKFANPEQHIHDKYYNKNSPYYVKGLTKKERAICSESEWSVLYGGQAAVNSYDPIIQKTFGGGIMNDTEWNADVRKRMNDTINQLFEENGIVIPEDADLRLRVDPYEYKIHASGVDEALARKIEDVLNKGKNGAYLYEHIEWCNPKYNGFKQPKQYLWDTALQEKAVIWHFVNDLTGYDIRKLENRNGIIYTPDGCNLWDVVKENYGKRFVDADTAGASLYSLYEDYQIYAKEGWSNEENRGLSIGYRNGFLYDIDTEYGYGPGQDEWLRDSIEQHKQYWESYQKSREEELQREEAASESSIFIEESEKVGNLSNNILEKYNNNTMLISPSGIDWTSLIRSLAQEGKGTALTEVILRLSRNNERSGFDAKA